ncbi:hypothetical protein [Methanococcus sp. CF]
MYYLSMIIVILASILYHICQKSISNSANPYVSLLITYLVSIVSTAVIIMVLNGKINIIESVKNLNWASYVLGISIVFLELGFLLVYRTGWNVSVAALTAYVAVAVLLIPTGILLFKENISFLKVLGISFCVLGLILINK